jgi:nucleoside-diphosphate-sugar epimerase
VYLVRSPAPVLATEADYDGPLSAEPTDEKERDDWRYGVDKRDAEDTLASSRLPATRLRIPMVHGGRDYQRRIESLVWRLLDGGPILLTRPDAPCRHVYGPAVARAIVSLLDEAVPVREFVQRVAAQLGVTADVRTTSDEALTTAGLTPRYACPFNSRWMSALDNTRARERLGFRHEALDEYLHACVHAVLSRLGEPPPSMAQRPAELAFAATLE